MPAANKDYLIFSYRIMINWTSDSWKTPVIIFMHARKQGRIAPSVRFSLIHHYEIVAFSPLHVSTWQCIGTRTSAVLQRVVWMWNHIHDQLSHMFESDPFILKQRLDIERQVCLFESVWLCLLCSHRFWVCWRVRKLILFDLGWLPGSVAITQQKESVCLDKSIGYIIIFSGRIARFRFCLWPEVNQCQFYIPGNQ